MNQVTCKDQAIGKPFGLQVNQAATIAPVSVPVTVQIGGNHNNASVEGSQSGIRSCERERHHNLQVNRNPRRARSPPPPPLLATGLHQ